MANKNENFRDVIINSCLSTISVLIGTAATQPLDIVKTRMQIDSTQANKSIMSSFKTIISNEGPKALFRGATLPVIGDSIVFSLMFATQNNFVLILNKIIPDLSENRKIFIAGTLAGFINSPIANTIELVKIRVQNTRDVFTGTNYKYILNSIQQEEGIKSFTRGLMATSVRDGVPSGFMFMAIDLSPKQFVKNGYNEFISNTISSMLALIASWSIQPADKLKSMIQSTSQNDKQSWKVGWKMFLNIQKERGMKGYFDGQLTLLIKSIPQQFLIVLLTNQSTGMQLKMKSNKN